MQKNEGAVFPQKAGSLKEEKKEGGAHRKWSSRVFIPCRLPSAFLNSQVSTPASQRKLSLSRKATHIASRPIQTRQHAKTHSALLRLRGPGLREICTARARCDSETGQLVADQTSVRLPNSDARMARRSQTCDIHSLRKWNA
jgi:hypothetical protein